ncbi:MAG: hypothetical protein AB1586_00845 [Pseudomonadota bacterium]
MDPTELGRLYKERSEREARQKAETQAKIEKIKAVDAAIDRTLQTIAEEYLTRVKGEIGSDFAFVRKDAASETPGLLFTLRNRGFRFYASQGTVQIARFSMPPMFDGQGLPPIKALSDLTEQNIGAYIKCLIGLPGG